MSSTDPIANVLGITPVEQLPTVAPAVVETQNQEFAKTQIRSAIQDGQMALGDLMQIASSSQHPRAYEVLATLIKTIAESSEKLAVLEMKQQEFSHKTQQQKGPGTVNNNLFVGNASELLKMLKSASKNTDGV